MKCSGRKSNIANGQRYNYKNLKRLMLENDEKAKDLREKIGLSPATMAKVNSGEALSLDVIALFCMHYKCDIGDIVSIVPDSITVSA